MGPKGPRSLMAMECRRGRKCRKFAVYSPQPDDGLWMGWTCRFWPCGRLGVDKNRKTSQGDFLHTGSNGVLTHAGYGYFRLCYVGDKCLLQTSSRKQTQPSAARSSWKVNLHNELTKTETGRHTSRCVFSFHIDAQALMILYPNCS